MRPEPARRPPRSIRQKWSAPGRRARRAHALAGPGRLLGRNAAWLRAPQVVAPDRATSGATRSGGKPQAQARPGAARAAPRAEAEPAPAGLVLGGWTSRSRRASPSSSLRRRATARSSTARRPRAPSASSSATATRFLPRTPRSRASRSSSRARRRARDGAPRPHAQHGRAPRVYTVVLTKRTRGKPRSRTSARDLFPPRGRAPRPVRGFGDRVVPPRSVAAARRDPRLRGRVPASPGSRTLAAPRIFRGRTAWSTARPARNDPTTTRTPRPAPLWILRLALSTASGAEPGRRRALPAVRRRDGQLRPRVGAWGMTTGNAAAHRTGAFSSPPSGRARVRLLRAQLFLASSSAARDASRSARCARAGLLALRCSVDLGKVGAGGLGARRLLKIKFSRSC